MCLYHSYLKSIEPLNDAERGRLFTALLEYSSTGAAQELRGNERILFPTMKEQIDRDAAKYEARCAKNRENGAKGGEANAKRSVAFGSERPPFAPQEKGKGKGEGEGKGKGKSPLGNSARGAQDPAEMVRACSFAPDLEYAVNDWLKYKAERRESYKPTGLKSLLTQMQNNAAEYGDSAVAEAIRQSMGSNYQGIVFDRLKKGGAVGVRRNEFAEKPKRWGNISYAVGGNES